ncbi:uncharacterized protein LOC125073422 [Vanessa atalanta]|uniref:uncharacterized protein LOC125073422 n=1 Tax=Vanessa atalanta TaxID=42275 RepID=UPI001FCDBA4A|nr:uncharacterized protein LOC125073422 [Vanessa atalanta]
MRSLILFAVVFLMTVFVYSSPINPKRLLINRPKEHDIFKRSAQVKGAKPGTKGYNPPPPVDLRKGEFMCGNSVCKLKPGEIPKGCNGICQYPLDPMP